MIMKCLEMRSLLQACGMFYWKILCCHDYGSTIDINDVLHYYQFHFVPDFLSFYAAMTAQIHSMVAFTRWMMSQWFFMVFKNLKINKSLQKNIFPKQLTFFKWLKSFKFMMMMIMMTKKNHHNFKNKWNVSELVQFHSS